MNSIKIFWIAILLLAACENRKRPEGVMPEKKMVAVLTDLHVIDGYMSILQYTDSLRINSRNFYATVYKKHQIDEKSFEKSLKYYSMNPALLDSMYKQVENNVIMKENRLNQIRENKAKKAAAKQ